MEFTDTHAHVYLHELDGELHYELEEAEKEGVMYIIMPAVDSTTHAAMVLTHEIYSNIMCMMGVHPCSIKDNYREELKIAADYLENENFVGIGETGLDFHWDLTWKEEQYEAFQVQIDWALQYDLPVVIHSRKSLDECIRVIKKNQNGKLTGVFHCFSGTLEQAQQIIDLGFYLGIGGVLTYKNAGLDKVMEQIPLEHVVLETDTPYLAPVPYRGKKNEVKFIKFTAQKLAEIKQVPLEEIAAITTHNAFKLFKIPQQLKTKEQEP